MGQYYGDKLYSTLSEWLPWKGHPGSRLRFVSCHVFLFEVVLLTTWTEHNLKTFRYIVWTETLTKEVFCSAYWKDNDVFSLKSRIEEKIKQGLIKLVLECIQESVGCYLCIVWRPNWKLLCFRKPNWPWIIPSTQ